MLERLRGIAAVPRYDESKPSHPNLSETACTCDDMGMNGPTLRDSVDRRDGIFGNVSDYRSAAPHYSGRSRADYALLSVRALS